MFKHFALRMVRWGCADSLLANQNRSVLDAQTSLSGGLNGLTDAGYHYFLAWHCECDNKHNNRCKVKEALESFTVSLDIKVLAYYGYSEFWWSDRVPNIISQIATEALCLLLYTKSNSNRLANLTWQKLRFANSSIFLPSTIKTHLQSFGKSHLPKPKEVGPT